MQQVYTFLWFLHKWPTNQHQTMAVADCQNTLNTPDLTSMFLYKGKGIVFTILTM